MRRSGWLVLLAMTVHALVTPAAELAGKGTWHSTNSDAVKGTWSATLTRSETEVRGTMTIDGSNVFTGGEVEGTVEAGKIVLGVFQQGSRVAHFAGKADGDAVIGEWSCPAIADEGVWEGRLPGIGK
jgi:hypothetical protein